MSFLNILLFILTEYKTSEINYFVWSLLEHIGYFSEEILTMLHSTNWIIFAMTMKEIRDNSIKFVKKISCRKSNFVQVTLINICIFVIILLSLNILLFIKESKVFNLQSKKINIL